MLNDAMYISIINHPNVVTGYCQGTEWFEPPIMLNQAAIVLFKLIN